MESYIEEHEAKELQTLLGLGGDVTDTDTGAQAEFPEEPKEPEEIPEDTTLAEVKRICEERLSDACQQVIFNGVDVEMSDGTTKHFTLKVEDQLNLLSLTAMASSGAQAIPYHAEGELCVYYSAEDISRIAAAATQFKTYHISYFNSLKNWIESMQRARIHLSGICPCNLNSCGRSYRGTSPLWRRSIKQLPFLKHLTRL